MNSFFFLYESHSSSDTSMFTLIWTLLHVCPNTDLGTSTACVTAQVPEAWA